jgi:protein tyrosine/serine phosphatase
LHRAAAVLLWAFLAGCASPSESPVRNVHTVTPGLLVRGGQPDEAGLRALKNAYGIRTVVNFNERTAGAEAATAGRLELNYLALPTDPLRLSEANVLAFLKVLDDARSDTPVYVHCKDGMDRTGVAVAAYRIVDCGWTADLALAELRRHQSFPHELFFQNVPPFVRRIGRQSKQWAARLAAAPEPPVRRAGPPALHAAPKSLHHA